MAWIDYKKAFDMVPHSWIIESLKLAQLAPNVIDFVGRSMKSWSTEQAGCIVDKHWVRYKSREAYSREIVHLRCCL